MGVCMGVCMCVCIYIFLYYIVVRKTLRLRDPPFPSRPPRRPRPPQNNVYMVFEIVMKPAYKLVDFRSLR